MESRAKTRTAQTLAGNERRLKPLSALIVVACDLACAGLLSQSLGFANPLLWACGALLAGAICCVNTYGLLGPGAAIGAMPASLFALAPAALPGALGLPAGEPAQAASTATYFLSCALIAYFAHWFSRLRRSYRDAPHIAADACIVVLGGYIVDGKPCRTVQSRLEVAGRLWRASPARRILLTGGLTHQGDATEAEAMASWLVEELGIPAPALLIEPEATNTAENLAYAQALLAREGLSGRQMCLVSSDYHLHRALSLARELGIEPTCAPAPVPLTSRLQQWCREVLILCMKGIS